MAADESAPDLDRLSISGRLWEAVSATQIPGALKITPDPGNLRRLVQGAKAFDSA